MLSRRGRRRRRWAAKRNHRKWPREKRSTHRQKAVMTNSGFASGSDGSFDFFVDVSPAPVTEATAPARSAEGVLSKRVPQTSDVVASNVVVPEDGPGGCPQGWEFHARDSARACSSKRADQVAANEDNVELDYPNLQEYLSSRPLEPQRRQQAEECRRYYGGTCGSASATQTDDGYLTKFGSKRVCIVCLDPGHKARACPQLRCFICFGVGHESKRCPKAQLKCGKCGRKGHDRDGCVWEVLVDAARWQKWNWVRCCNCGKFGHPMCSASDCKNPQATATTSKTVFKEEAREKLKLDHDRKLPRAKPYDSVISHESYHERNHWRARSDRGADDSRLDKGKKKNKRRFSVVDDSKFNKNSHNGRKNGKMKPAHSMSGNDLRAELRAKLANQHGRNGNRGKENFHTKINSCRNGTAFHLHESPKRNRGAVVAAAMARCFR